MCGITAIAALNLPIDMDMLARMTHAISHRGPDQDGAAQYEAGSLCAGLGSKRLSIIDLSEAGRMPLSNEDGSIWIVYNGELYNHPELRVTLEARGHVFRSNSDTETIVHAYEEYGDAFLERLNGMFALALFDQHKQRLVVARDPLGIKPVYYHWDGGRLLLASELRALLASCDIKREIDPAALGLYLSLGYVPSPYSLVCGVRKLEPGAYLVLDSGGLHSERYWTPPAPEPHADLSTAVQHIRATVTGAVRRQLMSDVPIGVFLSGGLDSTLIAHLAVRDHNGPIASFSIGFPDAAGRVDETSIYNRDLIHARQVARDLGMDHHELLVSPTLDVPDLLVRSVVGLDEPTWEPSFTSLNLLAAEARKHGAIVILTGDGSDELFGGYPWHTAAFRHQTLERVPALRTVLPLLKRIGRGRTLGIKARDLRAKLHAPVSTYYRYTFELLTGAEKQALVPRSFISHVTDEAVEALINSRLAGVGELSLSDALALLDLLLWVREQFNHRVDRMTMMHSVEARVPLQDLEVVRAALSVPLRTRLHGGRAKYLLREAFKDVVPEHVLNRPKRPFSTPTEGWLRGPLRPLIRDLLSAPHLDGSVLNPETTAALTNRFLSGDDRLSFKVWALLNFQIWYDHVMTI
ncbi:MAG: asparagine synthase (glutamine-hydrolyzing) [Anaerolineae bacterium]|nr:asparagine synthase (glutamine-hydrolyzing) [Anaerolineae bacterium]